MLNKHSQNVIEPLGSGDLIDRAIRIYRQNFWTFIQIASPPIILSMLLSILWGYLGRSFFSINNNNAEGYILFSLLGGFVIWFIEITLVLMVIGGASRDLVGHLLKKTPLSAKETYKTVWKRLSSLFFASLMVTIFLSICFVIVYQLLAIGLVITLLLGTFLGQVIPVIGVIVGVILGIAVILAVLYLYFYIISFFVYTPSIMMVEGITTSAAIGRNFSLTKGRARPLAALCIFTFLAAQAALFILYVPLLWYGYFYNIDFFSFDLDAVPFWYSVVGQLISQLSLILSFPVLMLGMGLLYVDERVRHEGYDIELMAARQLGEIPALPENYLNPLQPAISTQIVSPSPTITSTSPPSDKSIFGLRE